MMYYIYVQIQEKINKIYKIYSHFHMYCKKTLLHYYVGMPLLFKTALQ